MKKLFLAIPMLSIFIASGATSSANSVVNRIPVDVCIKNEWICIHQEGDRFDLLDLSNTRHFNDSFGGEDDDSRIASCGGWHGSQGKMKSQC